MSKAAVQQLLRRWAEWIEQQPKGLGYPSETAEGRAMRKGCCGSQGKGNPPVPYLRFPSRDIVLAHEAICRLGENEQSVVRYLYCGLCEGEREDTTEKVTVTNIAKRIGVSRREAYAMLDRAEHYIAGAVGISYA